jgi:hypothetical protein
MPCRRERFRSQTALAVRKRAGVRGCSPVLLGVWRALLIIALSAIQRGLIRTRETSHARVTLGNECVQLFKRNFVGSCHVIAGEVDEPLLCFRIGRPSREIEGRDGLTVVVIGTRHLERPLGFAPE